MELMTEIQGNTVIVHVMGDIDAHTAATVSEAVHQALAGNKDVLIIDLGGVRFMSSAGLRIILVAHQLAQETETTIVLAAPRAGVLRVLEMAGFTKIVTCYDSVDLAVAATS